MCVFDCIARRVLSVRLNVSLALLQRHTSDRLSRRCQQRQGVLSHGSARYAARPDNSLQALQVGTHATAATRKMEVI